MPDRPRECGARASPPTLLFLHIFNCQITDAVKAASGARNPSRETGPANRLRGPQKILETRAAKVSPAARTALVGEGSYKDPSKPCQREFSKPRRIFRRGQSPRNPIRTSAPKPPQKPTEPKPRQTRRTRPVKQPAARAAPETTKAVPKNPFNSKAKARSRKASPQPRPQEARRRGAHMTVRRHPVNKASQTFSKTQRKACEAAGARPRAPPL